MARVSIGLWAVRQYPFRVLAHFHAIHLVIPHLWRFLKRVRTRFQHFHIHMRMRLRNHSSVALRKLRISASRK